jgi:hypothetical protein
VQGCTRVQHMDLYRLGPDVVLTRVCTMLETTAPRFVVGVVNVEPDDQTAKHVRVFSTSP